MYQYPITIDILDAGIPLREIQHAGKTHVAGMCGQSYQLRIRNHSDLRVLAVCTVDGLSVMDGAPGDLHGGGYVIAPHGTIGIPGWRVSRTDVASFVFGGQCDSYAANQGRPEHVGVIGVAVFMEQAAEIWHWSTPWHCPSYSPYLPYTPYRWTGSPGTNRSTFGGGMIHPDDSHQDCANTSTLYSDGAGTVTVSNMVHVAPTSNAPLGTAFGPRQTHSVSETSFRRPSTPTAVVTLYYDTIDRLRVQGVPVDAPVAIAPQAFPASRQYCATPAGWVG